MISYDLEQALTALCYTWAVVGRIRGLRGVLSIFGLIDR